MHIHLTASGKLIQEKLLPLIQIENDTLASFSPEECEQLLRLNAKYNQALRSRLSNLEGIYKTMKIQLSEHFTYKKLLQFVFPSIIMMIFTSIYSVVDGLLSPTSLEKTLCCGESDHALPDGHQRSRLHDRNRW